MSIEQKNDSPNNTSIKSVQQPADNTQNVEIRISDDKLKCWIKLIKTSEEDPPSVLDVRNALTKNNIPPKMIKNDVLENIFDKSLFNQDFTIAEGIAPVDGAAGKLNYYVEQDKPLQEEKEDGSVNFKETDFVKQVKKGQVLADALVPKKGTDGVSVTGEIITAIQYDPEVLPYGRNTEEAEKNENQLIASVDGVVTIKQRKINVDPVLLIKTDVDYETGNIDFNGALIIRGGVKSGFSVKVAGDITISQIVEDAEITAGGEVKLKGGFLGTGKGNLNADGDVTLSFAENQNIYSGGDIKVTDALLNSTVEADGKVFVTGRKGVLGGSVSASDSIEVQSAGSDAFTKTLLSIGVKREVKEKMEEYKENAQNNKTSTIKIDGMIQRFEQLKRIKKTLPDKEKAQFVKTLHIKKKLLEDAGVLEKIKRELDEEYTKFDNAYVKVKDKAYPGVTIEIGGTKMTVEETLKHVIFKRSDDTIKILRAPK